MRIYIPNSSGEYKSCELTKNGFLVSGIWVRQSKYWMFASVDNGKYGIMDCQHKICIEPIFDFALSVDNLAFYLDIYKSNYNGKNRKTGDKLEFVFINSIQNFQENKLEIFDTYTRYPDAFLYFDETLEKTVIPNFDKNYNLIPGNKWFFTNGKFGLIDDGGDILLNALYDQVKLRPNGLAEVNMGNNYAVMDIYRNQIIPFSDKKIVHWDGNIYWQWINDVDHKEIKLKDKSYW